MSDSAVPCFSTLFMSALKHGAFGLGASQAKPPEPAPVATNDYERELYAGNGDRFPAVRREENGGVMFRDYLVDKYAWAVPNEAAIQALVRLSPLIEIGAGNGYWACLVRASGGIVEAYDRAPWSNAWTPVAKGAAKAIKRRHAGHTLVLCWPEGGGDALERFTRLGGQSVAYIGERRTGCTGDGLLHDLLARSYEKVETIKIPQRFGAHDSMIVYRRCAEREIVREK